MTSRAYASRAAAEADGLSLARLWPLAAAFLMATALLLGGCNTIEGFGEDVEEAGDEVDEEL